MMVTGLLPRQGVAERDDEGMLRTRLDERQAQMVVSTCQRTICGIPADDRRPCLGVRPRQARDGYILYLPRSSSERFSSHFWRRPTSTSSWLSSMLRAFWITESSTKIREPVRRARAM